MLYHLAPSFYQAIGTGRHNICRFTANARRLEAFSERGQAGKEKRKRESFPPPPHNNILVTTFYPLRVLVISTRERTTDYLILGLYQKNIKSSFWYNSPCGGSCHAVLLHCPLVRTLTLKKKHIAPKKKKFGKPPGFPSKETQKLLT